MHDYAENMQKNDHKITTRAPQTHHKNTTNAYPKNVIEPVQLTLPRRPFVVGIAGCSGSGKTTLARELASELSATLLTLDLYYHDLGHLSHDERAAQNFDHPDSLEAALLTEHVRQLAAGNSVQAPVYDFATHTRVPDAAEAMQPSDIILVEGILALHYEELRSLYNLSIYVNAPHDVCLMRRIHRDVIERGRTEESVRAQFWETAHPMAEHYVLPSSTHATLTVEGTDSLDWSVEQVLSTLRKHGYSRP
jgi:uridine kinase